jgi:hypothetical protein
MFGLIRSWQTASVQPNNLAEEEFERIGRRYGYLRPEKTTITERLAELRLANRYEWDLDIFRGKLPVTANGKSGAYRLLKSGPLFLQPRPQIRALRISRWRRFGNSIIQVRNAFCVAEALGMKTVCFPRRHPFLAGKRVGKFKLNWGEATVASPTLEGEFFYLHAFRLQPSAGEIARIFSELIRPLLVTQVRHRDPRIKRDDLVLHFRAGDIFKKPHPVYGQPPASYYLKAVDREQPARVWLVYEDRSNPCIEVVENALRAKGIEVLLQSSSLAEDLRLMMSARTLVAGRGSFAYMLAHLSSRLRRVYFFEAHHTRSLRELGIKVVIGKDADGEFKTTLLKDNWIGSPEQHALMLSYPADKLRFKVQRPFSLSETNAQV